MKTVQHTVKEYYLIKTPGSIFPQLQPCPKCGSTKTRGNIQELACTYCWDRSTRVERDEWVGIYNRLREEDEHRRVY